MISDDDIAEFVVGKCTNSEIYTNRIKDEESDITAWQSNKPWSIELKYDGGGWVADKTFNNFEYMPIVGELVNPYNGDIYVGISLVQDEGGVVRPTVIVNDDRFSCIATDNQWIINCYATETLSYRFIIRPSPELWYPYEDGTFTYLPSGQEFEIYAHANIRFWGEYNDIAMPNPDLSDQDIIVFTSNYGDGQDCGFAAWTDFKIKDTGQPVATTLETFVDSNGDGSYDYQVVTGVPNGSGRCDGKLKVSPNPFNGVVSIEYDDNEKQELGYVCIYNMRGALVERLEMDAGRAEWRCKSSGNNVASGSYVIVLYGSSGEKIESRQVTMVK